MRAGAKKALPRVLVTGFEPFPGSPVNPSEALARDLAAAPPFIAGMSAFRAEVLPVDYASIGPRLGEIGTLFAPDIAIHFGVAREARGFRLERTARNGFAGARPDNRGVVPLTDKICAGPATLASTLPLADIHADLSAAGLPVEWSDDAGGYLCNMAMTLSLAGACEGFAPRMSGFVHVPAVGEGAPMTAEMLRAGATLILGACVRAWKLSS